jgi:hypothetical protein
MKLACSSSTYQFVGRESINEAAESGKRRPPTRGRAILDSVSERLNYFVAAPRNAVPKITLLWVICTNLAALIKSLLDRKSFSREKFLRA